MTRFDNFHTMDRRCGWRGAAVGVAIAALLFAGAVPAVAQDDEGDAGGGQDAETKALDSTATQWSFQFAYQVMPSYYDDTLDNGQMRPEGNTDYAQLRIVAPISDR